MTTVASPITLGQLADLALGTPEVGAVNFNCLHTLIHGILGHLHITDRKAEISEEQQKLLNKKHDGDEESGFFSVHGPDGDDVTDAGSVTGSISDQKGKSSFRPKSSIPYHALESRMAKMESEMKALYDLPTNAELLKRSKENSSNATQPVNDMWSIMRLEKRVDANEQGISKLMSMMQDLMKELNGIKDEQMKLRTDLDGLTEKFNHLQKELKTIGTKIDGLAKMDALENFVTWEGLEKALKGLRDSIKVPPAQRVVVDMTQQTDKQVVNELAVQTVQVETVDRPVSALSSRPGSGRVSRGPSQELQALLEKLGQLTTRFDDIQSRVEAAERQIKDLWDRKANKEDLEGLTTPQTPPPPPQPVVVEAPEIPSDLLAQIAQLKSDVERLLNDRNQNEAALSKLQRALLDLQEEVAKLTTTVRDLIDENNEKQKHIEALYALAEGLQESKADKEYVDVELDLKADKKQLDGKVSRALFDSTIEDLNRLINDLLAKYSGNEEEWKKTCAQLSKDLDGKLDRLELDPLREYLERRIKQLDKRTQRAQTETVIEDEAAILRKQLLTRFNCLSCDRPVDMVPGEPVQNMPELKGFPGKQTVRPYQVYELEQLRQHARRAQLPPIEQAWRSYSQVQADVSADYYAVSRSCGGGHTLTYPHKRSTKVPANYVAPVVRDEPDGAYSHRDETDIQGADGHIYKARMPKDEIRRITVSQQIRRLAQTDQRPGTSPASAVTPQPHASAGDRPASARVSEHERASTARPLSSGGRRSEVERNEDELTAEMNRPDGASEPEHAPSPPPQAAQVTVPAGLDEVEEKESEAAQEKQAMKQEPQFDTQQLPAEEQ